MSVGEFLHGVKAGLMLARKHPDKSLADIFRETYDHDIIKQDTGAGIIAIIVQDLIELDKQEK